MLFKSEVDVWDFIFQVFFFLAAITGCISVIVNIKFSEDLLMDRISKLMDKNAKFGISLIVSPLIPSFSKHRFAYRTDMV
uniref:Uncharacterized protein n=1 Tax=Helianthus annuus TaxID=4232 RepID=A0A251TF17_HELAN